MCLVKCYNRPWCGERVKSLLDSLAMSDTTIQMDGLAVLGIEEAGEDGGGILASGMKK
jgi:hypothetical protein